MRQIISPSEFESFPHSTQGESHFKALSSSVELVFKYFNSKAVLLVAPCLSRRAVVFAPCGVTCGIIIIKIRFSDQRDRPEQSDVDFQIKRANSFLITQIFPIVLFLASGEFIRSVRSSEQKFNIIFSSLLFCSRCVFLFWPRGVRAKGGGGGGGVGMRRKMFCGE